MGHLWRCHCIAGGSSFLSLFQTSLGIWLGFRKLGFRLGPGAVGVKGSSSKYWKLNLNCCKKCRQFSGFYNCSSPRKAR